MSKPNWKDAPVWARYLAQDPTGNWYWFSRRPVWIKRHAIYCSPESDETICGFAGESTFKGRCIKRPKVKP